MRVVTLGTVVTVVKVVTVLTVVKVVALVTVRVQSFPGSGPLPAYQE